ncbi:hypothetical protein B0H19DRAFT_1134037 [Mycena capillaripes]|nr:hypothetical protein B0H19DRAFT_1134037 [Mycena capillaripes]
MDVQCFAMSASPPPPDAFRPAITYFLGGWDLAICADLVLQGIIFAQIAHYTALYDKDALALRAFVAVLLIITTLKSAQGMVILWNQNVQHFMDIQAALGMFKTSWINRVDLALVGAIAFYVQGFFCIRLWRISRNLYIVGSIVTLFVFALIAVFIFTFAGKSKNVTWFTIHLGTVFAGDVLLCGSTLYFLLYHSKSVSPQSAGMLNALTKLAIQSAAPAAVCALITLVSTLAWDRTTPNAYIMIGVIANNVLPKLYAMSAMWTLNSRKKIRQAHSIGPKPTTATSGRRRPTFELSSVWVASDRGESIEIQTQNLTPLDDLSKHNRAIGRST